MKIPNTLAVLLLLLSLAGGAAQAHERVHHPFRAGHDHHASQREIRHAVSHRSELRRHHREHGHWQNHETRQTAVRTVVPPWLASPRHVMPLRVARLPPTPEPEPVWYFCANPVGYHPYVDHCHVTWQVVPANAWPAPR